MNEREQIIQNYFQCWISKDRSVLKKTFAENAFYSECYGPEYHGLDMIERWFDDWNRRGKVFLWDIKQFIHQQNLTAVEWHFKCEQDGNTEDFNGVSWIEFNDANLIIILKEFQSKIPHYCPYKEG